MGNGIFLLDISHLTETGMTSFIKGEIVLSDNIEVPFSEPVEQLPQNNFPVQAGMSIVLFCLEGGDTYTNFFEGICLASEYVLRYNHGNDF